MDCGASTSITESLLNCVDQDVNEYKAIIEPANEGKINGGHTYAQQDIFCEEPGW